ncbi:MAG TPA: creatininase family protein [Dictyoglomaceae bacterium]|nr:creatininase family protein [Dictyoglomaceae bacterium]HOL39935.1 creatininase family protein [Dictyoglomaceae bacterium]HOP95639.1 creatininase family protein [Dictyoglomaceae bacterium]HPP16397.1 creatininase family protein [Dictyoglomaceae bacterium]HPU43636.1 creatininase family protein [Dictyoglomaceae bacterium]
MLRYKYETMFPHQLREVLDKFPVVYLPVSPLEWHGEHLIFGTDPFRARRILEGVWEKLGGVILPTLYVGTDITNEKDHEILWGMETFAGEKIPGSIFLEVDVFYKLLKNYLFFLERTGFKLCVICTGHMAKDQVEVITKIEEEHKDRSMKVLAWYDGKATPPKELLSSLMLHAGVEETSEILNIDLSYVDLDRVGSREVDRKVNLTKENLKNVSSELGAKLFQYEIDALVKEVNTILANL